MDIAGSRVQEELGHGQQYRTRASTGPVECLGLTFEDDAARKEHFLEKLREKLKDPEFRKIEGFPLGSDEDILALSDPPYYTACPNPFVKEFVKRYGKPYDPENDDYRREPFAADVSEGKNDPIYNAHSYHTKVPHKAIMRYILHYTGPGDVVFDGFCGTGMTGVAAQLCGDQRVIESLGYRMKDDGTILDEEGRPFSKIGPRRAVLNDLSPAATFIAYNYNTPVDVDEFEREANRILEEVEAECGWMYLTLHEPDEDQMREALDALREDPSGLAGRPELSFGRINYTVWSDVFVCPECSGEVVFWDVAVDRKAGKVYKQFPCPHCSARLTKDSMERTWVTKFDPVLDETIHQSHQVPVLINYKVNRKRFEKVPDAFDLALVARIDSSNAKLWFPTDTMMHVEPGEPWGDEWRPGRAFEYVHHLSFRRAFDVLGHWRSAADTNNNLNLVLTAALTNCTRMYRWRANQKGGTVSGTFYLPSTPQELNPLSQLESKKKTFASVLGFCQQPNAVSTQSASKIPAKDSSLDYIFTDPPFGGNLAYSELNFPWEAWLKVYTNNQPEAIESATQGKDLPEYQELMSRCFEEYHRVLKPGRWMTVEFHNSKNSVWNAIQEALQRAGFVVADVRTLNKQQGTFKQVTSAAAVKQDLVISAYKPGGELERRFELEAGTEEGVWDFVGAHLRQLPVFVPRNGALEVVAERMNYLLFDRMVAFHVQRGVTVPISAAEFYAGLKQRYPERDGMFFAPDQVAEYDRKRMNVRELMELQLFITGEASAIQWLRQELSKKPQTFQELSPAFMKDMGWAKHEKPLELGDLLRENFLRHKEGEPIPDQIISWMKRSARLRPKIVKLEARAGDISATGLETHDPELIAAAKDRWYVPDPNKAQDLEKLREGALLKEFDTYKTFKGRRLKVFRLEAVRAGFKKAWGERDYHTILAIAGKIPEPVLQEDSKLLMWYDQALARTEG